MEFEKPNRRRQGPWPEEFMVSGSAEYRETSTDLDSSQHLQHYYLAHHGAIFK